MCAVMEMSEGADVARVVAKATDKKLPALGADDKHAVMSLCRVSRDNVEATWRALQGRLQVDHVQVAFRSPATARLMPAGRVMGS